MTPLRRDGGFTLVEILVAIAILVILGVIFAQITSMTSKAISLSNLSVDASAQASLAFNRIRLDVAALVKRPDVDFIAQNPSTPVGGGNIMLFLAGVSSPGISPSTNTRDLSVVAYQINDSSDNDGRPCLLRAGKAVAWSNAGFMGMTGGLPLSFTNSAFPAALLPSTAATPSDFDVLAPGVIRLVIGFQLYPDNLPVTLEDGTTPTPANAEGQVVYSPPIREVTPTGGGAAVQYIDLKRIAALVIGVVALNGDSIKLMTSAQVTSLAGAFSVPGDQTLPLKNWATVADNLASTGPSTVPLAVRQAVHVFQQTFPVTPYGAKGD